MAFQKAERKQKKARIALYGPSGSGKTYTALSLASGLGDKIAVIDTERGSASLYADKFSFDTLELSNFNANHFIDAIAEAEKAGYDVVVIDSLSHAWQGTGGILDKVDSAGGNGFTNGWGKVGTPLYNKLIDSILDSKVHVIACMRSKTDYVMEKDSRGKDAPKKVGVGAVMRQDAEYEFDYVGLMDTTNTMTTQKTRMGEVLPDATNRPNKATGAKILAWLTSGAAQVTPAPKPVAPKVEPVIQKAQEMGGELRITEYAEPQAPQRQYLAVNEVNRAAVNSLQTQIDTGYFDGDIGIERLKSSMLALNEQLVARNLDKDVIKGQMAKPTAWNFFKLAVGICAHYDSQAPVAESDSELQPA